MNPEIEEDIKKAAAVDDVMQFFSFSHLPGHLQDLSRPFAELALKLVKLAPRNAQRTMALNKLVEAKDNAVRAMIHKDHKQGA